MFSRALLVALCIAYATSLSPLTAAADDDCALYLTGPGRSSAYDYSLNLLKGNFAYDGQHTCITYEAINQAYLDARARILVSQPKGDWKAEDFASAGELLLDISISLARTYGLTYEEIEKGLPLIDTSRTLIREVCPPVFSHVECRAGKYRRLDGLCNNLRHPTWGATMAPFQRLIGPLFADGINAPRISHTGHDLPLSRVVSRTMHPDDGFHDHAGTVMVIAWGQFMDHDYTLTGTPLDPIHRNDPEECCKRPPHLKHPYCNEIRVPDDDYFYRLFNVKCIDFVRGFPSPRPGCRLGSRVPFNTLTGSIDGNTVYGVTEKFARKLRTGYGGLLRMNPVFKEYGLKDLLPLKLDIPDEGCTRPNKNMYCFEAGEIRVNEQLVLTVMHTLMAREHNRVAKALAAVNPHWDDETLFQEARRINIAEIQHITYNEFLPILLGKDVMEKFGLVLEKEGYWDGYDPEVNPDVIASFAAAAYRFGHSLLPTAVERWSKAHKFIASKRLSDLIRRPYDLYRAGVLDEYVMGLMNQVAQAMDDSITQEVTNHLFKKVGARFGMDLVSFNMQRGREFGLPGYMEFRKFCGLSGADSFQDLFGSMPNETIHKYESIFEHPIDVDLWSGGVSERPLPGSMLGPTFACIIATQFSYSRRGDRFWFELPNQPSSFTPEQMVEIRKSRLARIICDNTDIIDTVQLYPMVLPDHELNPRVPCRSGIIPSMDFSKWAEPTPFLGGAKEYMTDAYVCNKTKEPNATNDITISEQNTAIKSEQGINVGLNISIRQPNSNQNDSIISTPAVINNVDCINETNNKENSNTIQTSEKIDNADTVLKYVYKKGDNKAIEKTTGHIKNSLRRKKRNVLEKTKHAPLLFNVNTRHINNDKEEYNLPLHTPSGFVKNDNLADFNIKTSHNLPNSANSMHLESKDKYHNQYLTRVPASVGVFIENNEELLSSHENASSTENINKSLDYDESNEDDNDVETAYDNNSKNNGYYKNNANKNHLNEYKDTSDSTNKDYIEKQESKDSDENEEQYSSRLYNTPNEKNESINPENKYNKGENENSKRPNVSDSKEYILLEPKSSEESIDKDEPQREQDYSLRKDERNHISINENFNKTAANQEFDLNNLSYEAVRVNDNEQIEPTNDSVEYNNDNPKINHALQKEPFAKITNVQPEPLTLTHENTNDSNENSDEYDKQVKINDGEVKPVIELNNEDSDEESDENSKESLNANLKKKMNEKENIDTSQEIEAPEDKVNIKQQFERIPLDYVHTDKKSSNDENIQEDADGTLDTISPKKDNFDEHLNIKFSDISIKLPEIKLPDDILAYGKDDSVYANDKKKKKNTYYHYEGSDEDSDEDTEGDSSKKSDEDKNDEKLDFYRSYFYEPNEKLQKINQESNEDLYEKFVRERFGKGKSSKQKSQKLLEERQKPSNPKLYEKIQNVLKKANDIQNEAEKSGDPEAGYLWTLEYGENL